MIINDFLEGLSLTAYEYFGAHFVDRGVHFATYAPNARNVTLMLNGGEYEMNRLDSGVWETVRPAENGDIYQFIITTQAL